MEDKVLYSVKDVVELTSEKTGNVDFFRRKLREYGLLDNNANLDQSQLDVFKALCNYKRSVDTTWEYATEKFIYENFLKGAVKSFRIHEEIILKHLIWKIKNDLISVVYPSTDANSSDFHEVYDILIDNFMKIGVYDRRFEDSFGSDGNPLSTFKCIDHDLRSFYYIIGKLGKKSMDEEIHIFYNDGLIFNIMTIQYITGGIIDKEEVFEELYMLCADKASIQ